MISETRTTISRNICFITRCHSLLDIRAEQNFGRSHQKSHQCDGNRKFHNLKIYKYWLRKKMYFSLLLLCKNGLKPWHLSWSWCVIWVKYSFETLVSCFKVLINLRLKAWTFRNNHEIEKFYLQNNSSWDVKSYKKKGRGWF